MAAAVAIMLYIELPRVAFEAQRSKEELLIPAANNISAPFSLLPQIQEVSGRLEDLENTNNVRFCAGGMSIR